MASPALHVVFGDAAADDLRQALARLGRDDRVVALGYDFGKEMGEEAAAFWIAALAETPRRGWPRPLRSSAPSRSSSGEYSRPFGA